MEMEAKSVITFPSGDMKLPGVGFYDISGLAWSGRGRVQSVDVSVDGGQSGIQPISSRRRSRSARLASVTRGSGMASLQSYRAA